MSARRWRSFPGEFAGASLKRFLIGFAIKDKQLPFPGEFAGASLKHQFVDDDDTSLGLVPRRIRRGLIEAQIRPGLRPTAPRPFPGEFAGASLKQAAEWAAERAPVTRSPANSPGPH